MYYSNIFLRVEIDRESLLGPCLHLRSSWGCKCNSLEHIRGDLGERLSWWMFSTIYSILSKDKMQQSLGQPSTEWQGWKAWLIIDSNCITPIRFGIGVQMRAWLSVMSGLLATLIVSLLWCVKVDTLRTLCKEDLDQTHHHFIYFYIIDKLHFYFLISFWYPYFFLLPTNSLAHNWELSLPLLFVCHSKHLFCPF